MVFMRNLLLLGYLSYFAWSDQKTRRIQNRALLSMALLGSAAVLAEGNRAALWTDCFHGFLLGGMLAFFCYLLAGGGLGAGDVKLVAVMGAYLGRRILETMFVSFLLAAVCGGFLCVRFGRRRLPLAPFLLSGTVIVLGYGLLPYRIKGV